MSPSQQVESSKVLAAELSHCLNRFFLHLDRSDYHALLSLTREDFRWHRQGKILEGHVAVRAALSERAVKQRTVHVITNAAIESDQDAQITLGAYMTAYRSGDLDDIKAPATIAGPLRLSRVTTRFTHDDRQGWLIAEQILLPLFEFQCG